jgi:hypothetical protein
VVSRAGGWVAETVRRAREVVVVVRVGVSGLRRLDTALGVLSRDRDGAGAPGPVVAAVGPPRGRWPRGLRHEMGPLAREVEQDGRWVDVPWEVGLATRGVDGTPLPRGLLRAAGALLGHLTGPGVSGADAARATPGSPLIPAGGVGSGPGSDGERSRS